MFEMTKTIYIMGKVMTMDSGFCVTIGILDWNDVGVFGQALVKKRGWLWSKHVPCNQIDELTRDKPLGGDATTLKQCIF